MLKKLDVVEIALALCLVVAFVAFVFGKTTWQTVLFFAGLLTAKVAPSGWQKPWPPETEQK